MVNTQNCSRRIVNVVTLLIGCYSVSAAAASTTMTQQQQQQLLQSTSMTLLYVSPYGSDIAPGTKLQPLRTLHAARDQLRRRSSVQLKATVFIRAGVHDLSRFPLELDERDSHVEWRGFPGERPLLSGGMRVPLSSATPWPGSAGAMRVDLRRLGVSEAEMGKMRLPDLTKVSGLYDCQHGVMDVFAAELRRPMVLARWPNQKNGSWAWAPMGSGSGRCALPGRPTPGSETPLKWKPSPAGQRAADAYCEKHCFPLLKNRPCDGPTVARYGRSSGSEYAWRCYSPSQLHAATFGNCTESSRLGCCLCTDIAGIRAALNASGDPAPPPPPPPPLCSQENKVWFTCPDCGDRPRRWKEEGGGWWHGYAITGYADQYVPILNITPTQQSRQKLDDAVWNLTLFKPPHDPGLKEGNPFMVLNLLSELDAEGEFFVFTNGTLVFIPWAEQDIKKDAITVSMAPHILRLRNLSRVTVAGLRFAFARGTGLIAQNVTNVMVDNVTSHLHGEDGIRIEHSWNSTISHSSVSNVGCVGIALSGGDPGTLQPGNLLLHDSNISNFSQWKRTYRPGLEWAGVANEFRSNIFENGPHSCVLGGASESEMTELEHLRSISCRFVNNTFRHCAFECSDCGAWYSCGQSGNAFVNPNNTISDNRFEDITGRLFGANAAVHAIYLDDMLSGYKVAANLFTNCSNAVFVGGGRNTTIVDNRCEGCSTMIEVDSRGKYQEARCANVTGDTRRALVETNVSIPGSPWNKAFPSLQRIGDDHPCLPAHTVLRSNHWCGGREGDYVRQFSVPPLNDSQWKMWLATLNDNGAYPGPQQAAHNCPTMLNTDTVPTVPVKHDDEGLMKVQFQTTVFSRDWLGPRKYAQRQQRGSPWCDAGCIPPSQQGTETAKMPKPPLFRVPSIAQLPNGTILAISGERNGTEASMLVSKYSTDSGRSFSRTQRYVAGRSSAQDSRPSADMAATVYDRHAGQLVMIYQSDGSSKGPPSGCSLRLTTSRDGVIWTPSCCLDSIFPEPDRTKLSPGPGVGLQLASGRLLFSVHATFKRAFVIWSDTGGADWNLSKRHGTVGNSFESPADSFPASECQLAQVQNGSVVLNCRPYPEQTKATDGRGLAVSFDGGITFDSWWMNLELWGANAASGLAVLTTGHRDDMYYSSPRNNNSVCPYCRTHMAVLHSSTDGLHWAQGSSVSVWRGEAGYSVMMPLADGALALLYERGSTADHYHNITFARLAPSTIKTDDTDFKGLSQHNKGLVVPAPQQWHSLGGKAIVFTNATVILADLKDTVANTTAIRLQASLAQCCGIWPQLQVLAPATTDIHGKEGASKPQNFIAIGGRTTPGLAALLPPGVAWPHTTVHEGYSATVQAGPGGVPEVFLLGNSAAAEFYATQTLIQLVNHSVAHSVAPCRIDDWPDSEIRGYYFWEEQTNDLDMPWIEWLVDTMSHHKMNFGLYHNELFFELDFPFGKNGTKTWRQALQEVAALFFSRFIAFVPELQSGGGGGTGIYHPNSNEGLFVQGEPFSVVDGFLQPVRPPLPHLDLNGDFRELNSSVGMPIHWHCCHTWAGGDCTNRTQHGESLCSVEHPVGWANAKPGARVLRANLSASKGAYSTGGIMSDWFDLGPNPSSTPSYYYFSAQYQLDKQCVGEPPEIVLIGQEGGGAGYELPHFSGVDSNPDAAGKWTQMGSTMISKHGQRVAFVVRIHGSGNCSVVVGDFRILRASSALVNVIRTNATDLRVRDATSDEEYINGHDYLVVNPDPAVCNKDSPYTVNCNNGNDCDLVRMYGADSNRKGRYQIQWKAAHVPKSLLVSYDFLPSNVNEGSYDHHPSCFAEPLWVDIICTAVNDTMHSFNSTQLMMSFDEIWGMNRDSRSQALNLSNGEAMARAINIVQNCMDAALPSLSLSLGSSDEVHAWIWDDMVNPYHTGGRNYEQASYGGPMGNTSSALATVDKRTRYVSWGYEDKPFGREAEMIDQDYEIFGRHALNWVAGTGTTPGSISAWTSAIDQSHDSFGYAMGLVYTQWVFSDADLSGLLDAANLAWNHRGYTNFSHAGRMDNEMMVKLGVPTIKTDDGNATVSLQVWPSTSPLKPLLATSLQVMAHSHPKIGSAIGYFLIQTVASNATGWRPSMALWACADVGTVDVMASLVDYKMLQDSRFFSGSYRAMDAVGYVQVQASAYNAARNQSLGVSTPITVYFDLRFTTLTHQLEFDVVDHNRVLLRAVPDDPALGKLVASWSFDLFVRSSKTGWLRQPCEPGSGVGGYKQNKSAEYHYKFGAPGVYFVGLWWASNEFNASGGGRTGRLYTPPAPLIRKDGKLAFQPIGFVVPFSDGSSPPLPNSSEFSGTLVRLQPVANDEQLCIPHRSITIPGGPPATGAIFLPLCAGAGEPVSRRTVAHLALKLPEGLEVLPAPSWSIKYCSSCVGGASYVNYSQAVQQLPNGLWVLNSTGSTGRLPDTPAGPRAYTNKFGEFVTVCLKAQVGLIGKSFAVQLALYDNTGGVPAPGSKAWQEVTIVVAAWPNIPPPRHLLTALTDAPVTPWQRMIIPDHGHTATEVYARLGLSVIIQDPIWTSAGFRPETSESYRSAADVGLRVGIRSTFGGWNGTGLFSLLGESRVDPARLPVGLTDQQKANELLKWHNALVFKNATGLIDLAYDGFMLKYSLREIEEAVNAARADFVFSDVERFPCHAAYVDSIHLSANAQARRRHGDMEPGPFTADQFAKFGERIVPQFGLYNAEASYPIELFVRWIRMNRQAHEAVGLRNMMPWYTTGFDGVTSDTDALVQTVHLLVSGSTGFNLFAIASDGDWDSWGHMFAIARAVGWVRPFEDIVVYGTVAFAAVVQASNVRAISAMHYQNQYLVALTAHDGALPMRVKLNVSSSINGGYSLHDAIRNTTVLLRDGQPTFEIKQRSNESVALIVLTVLPTEVAATVAATATQLSPTLKTDDGDAVNSVSLPTLLPLPQHLSKKEGGGLVNIRCGAGWLLVAPSSLAAASSLREALATGLGCTLPVVNHTTSKQSLIILSSAENYWRALPAAHRAEGYVLESEAYNQIVTLAAPTSAGIFYAAQTLLQLLGLSTTTPALRQVPEIRIVDYPDLATRGFYLWCDKSNNPDVPFVESVVDLMSSNKLNFWIFHNEFFFIMDRPNSGKQCSEQCSSKCPEQCRKQFQQINDYSRKRHMEMVPELHVGGGGGPTIWFPELAEGVWVRNETFEVTDGWLTPIQPPLTGLPKNGNMTPAPGGSTVPGWLLHGVPNSSSGCRPERTSSFDTKTGRSSFVNTIRCDQLPAGARTSGDKIFAISEPLPTTAGGVYHVSAKLRLNSTNCSSTPPVFFMFYQTTTEQVVSTSVGLPYQKHTKTAPASLHFTTLSMTYIAPEHDATAQIMSNIPPGSSGGCTWWIHDVRLLRASSAIVNVLRTNATDLEVTSATEPGRAFSPGRDFEVVAPPSWTNIGNGPVDLVAAYEAGQSTRIRAIKGGKLREGQQVNVSFDFLPGVVNGVGPPHAFAEPAYYDVIRRTIASVTAAFNLSSIFLDHDEIWGMNRDSRSRRLGLSNAAALAAEMNKLNKLAQAAKSDMRVLFWDDMLNPDHTGNRSNFQTRFGGQQGATWLALEQLEKDIQLISWWYDDPASDPEGRKLMHDAGALYNKGGRGWMPGAGTNAASIAGWAHDILQNSPTVVGFTSSQWKGTPDLSGVPITADYAWNLRHKTNVTTYKSDDREASIAPMPFRVEMHGGDGARVAAAGGLSHRCR